ncbi:hypothetical protein [Colwellia sp. MB02u-6]
MYLSLPLIIIQRIKISNKGKPDIKFII